MRGQMLALLDVHLRAEPPDTGTVGDPDCAWNPFPACTIPRLKHNIRCGTDSCMREQLARCAGPCIHASMQVHASMRTAGHLAALRALLGATMRCAMRCAVAHMAQVPFPRMITTCQQPCMQGPTRTSAIRPNHSHSFHSHASPACHTLRPDAVANRAAFSELISAPANRAGFQLKPSTVLPASAPCVLPALLPVLLPAPVSSERRPWRSRTCDTAHKTYGNMNRVHGAQC